MRCYSLFFVFSLSFCILFIRLFLNLKEIRQAARCLFFWIKTTFGTLWSICDGAFFKKLFVKTDTLSYPFIKQSRTYVSVFVVSVLIPLHLSCESGISLGLLWSWFLFFSSVILVCCSKVCSACRNITRKLIFLCRQEQCVAARCPQTTYTYNPLRGFYRIINLRF